MILKLRFGEGTLDKKPKPKSPVKVAAPITLFNASGKVATIGKPKFTYEFTCENDGGIQHQALAEVRVAKKDLARVLRPASTGWNVVGFAVVGTVEKARPITSEIVYFTADLDGDGKPDAALDGGPDEAMNCGEETGTHFSVDLRNAGGTTRLRCCGPNHLLTNVMTRCLHHASDPRIRAAAHGTHLSRPSAVSDCTRG